MRKSIWAISLSLLLVISGTVATATVRPAAPVGEYLDTIRFAKKSAKISTPWKKVISLLVDANSDAVAFDISGYAQSSEGKSRISRLSLARAKAIKRELEDLGVEVPITIHAAGVPTKGGGKSSARRAVIRAVAPPEDTTPELQNDITLAWGPTQMANASFAIADPGTWSYPPDRYEYHWQYSLDDAAWVDLADGPTTIYTNGDGSYVVSYDVSGATTSSVTMVGTGNANVMKTCVYVKAQVVAINGTYRSELTDSLELEPVAQCTWPS